MPRDLSLTARQALYAPETDQVFLLLLAISHADLTPSIRVVNNLTPITSRGDVYIAFPFTIALPDDRDDKLAEVELRIDNVDRQIVQAIRTITSAPTVTLEVILASDPDTVEAGPFEFTLRGVEYDALVVSGRLMFEDVLNEPFPSGVFNPSSFAGLF